MPSTALQTALISLIFCPSILFSHPVPRLQDEAQSFDWRLSDRIYGHVEGLWVDLDCRDLSAKTSYRSGIVISRLPDGAPNHVRLHDVGGWRMHACKNLLVAEGADMTQIKFVWLGIGKKDPRIYLYSRDYSSRIRQSEICVSTQIAGATWNAQENKWKKSPLSF